MRGDCEREYGLIRKIMSKIKMTGHFGFNEVGVQVFKQSKAHYNKYFWVENVFFIVMKIPERASSILFKILNKQEHPDRPASPQVHFKT